MQFSESDVSQGTLLRIGAGKSADIAARLRAPDAPARVILVEPNPALAKALQDRFATFPQVTVVAMAVGADVSSPDASSTNGLLHVFSDLSHSSLYPPEAALAQLLPGLHLAGTIAVPVVSMGHLLASLGTLPHPLHIEIDAPGAELDILSGLKASGHFDRVDGLDLRAGAEPLYAGATSARKLADWCEAEGLRLQQTIADDPDWPEMRLVPDRARRELERQLTALFAANQTQTHRVTELEAALQTRDTKIAQQEVGLADMHRHVQTRDAEQAQHLGNLAGELAQLRQTGDAKAHRISDLEQWLEGANTWAREQERLAQERAEQFAKLDANAATVQQQAASDRGHLADQISKLEQALSSAKAVAVAKEAAAKEQTDLATARAAKLAEAKADLQAKSTALADTQTALQTANASGTTNATARAAAEARLKEQTDLATARAAKLAEVEKGIDGARLASAEMAEQLNSALANHTATEHKLKTASDRASALDRAAFQLRDQIGQLSDDVRRGAIDLSTSRNDLGLSLRLQNRLQTDVRDLQERFGALQNLCRTQDELLRQLTPRLRDAARQLQTLALSNEPALGHEAGQVKAISGKVSKGSKKSKA